MFDDREKPANDVQSGWGDVPIKKLQKQADEALWRARQLLKLPIYPSDFYK